MDTKKILIISLITVAILASVSVVSAGFFDGLFGGAQDNVIEIENITFNTTNVTSFKLLNETEVLGAYARGYVDENDTGYNVHIINCSAVDDAVFLEVVQQYLDEYSKYPSQTIDGSVIYTVSADSGDHVGEPRYLAFVKNKDLKTFVEICSPDANETVKMISSLKFK